MIYLATGLIVAWLCIMLFLAGRELNLLRLILNNFAPGKDLWGSSNPFNPTIIGYRLYLDARTIDPESLTELGKQYQRTAIRNERMIVACILAGAILLVWTSSYFWAS
jgi:hypothetical protein